MSALGVIEVTERERLAAELGAESYRLVHEELIERLKSWVRPVDKLAVDKQGRVTVLLKGLESRGEISLAANKLRRLTEPAYDCFGRQVEVRVNAGFTLVLGKGDTREAAFNRATAALTRARRENQLFELYDEKERTERADERELLENLHRAVERGEFILYFQPKISAAYGNVAGVEALIRWGVDADTIWTPDRFIDVAERNDVIKPITIWAVKSAVARCARWPGEVGVSVNVPPRLLEDDDLRHAAADALELHGLEPQRLTFEVTEGVMAREWAVMFEELAHIRELGCRVSLDDFGTGYSSFTYFRDIPADEIKIDKSFVMPMLESEVDAAIVKTIIELAHNFSLKVVAEGVEDKATAEALKALNCDLLQGYFIDPPLPVEDLELRHQLG